MSQPTSHSSIEVTDANFEEIIHSSRPVLIDFWAAWCSPCVAIAPVIESLAKATAGRFVVGKLDVDKNPEAAMKYGVRSIPTMIIFKHGREVDRLLGGQHTQATLEGKLALQEGSV